MLASFGIYRSGGSDVVTVISGGGTPNYVARFVGTKVIGDGVIQDNGTNLGIGATPVADTRLLIKGLGLTNATRLIQANNSSNAAKLIVADTGQVSIGAGTTASIDNSFGLYFKTQDYVFGAAFYPNNATSAGVTIQMQGTTRTGLTVATQNSPVGGSVIAISSTSQGTASTTNIGVYSSARNGSQYNIGFDGAIIGGGSVTPSVYAAAVRGQSTSDLNSKHYGGYFSTFSSGSNVLTQDFVGVLGMAAMASANVASTSKVIGGQFLTSGTTGTGARMAIHVPLTGNNGNIVFGADNPTVNKSLLEVNGDIEITNSTNAIILQSLSGARWKVKVSNAGALQVIAA